MQKTQPMIDADAFDPQGAPFDEEIAGAEAPPKLKPGKRKKLPTGVAANVKQHLILACDVSSSMHGEKIDRLVLAREALAAELAHPENREGFFLSVVEFNHQAHRLHFAEPAHAIQLGAAQASGGTNFEAALQNCRETIRVFAGQPNPEGLHYLRPMIVFLSDGNAAVGDDTIAAVHEIADVIAAAYGDDANHATLSRIASDGQVHSVGVQGDQLRAFLAGVGQTLSRTLQSAD